METQPVETDEEQIRELVSTWISATSAATSMRCSPLIADDVVFLTPGQAPMSKAGFASLQKAQWAKGTRFEGTSAIQEIKVLGDWAFMWTKLAIRHHAAQGGQRIARAGHTLTVLSEGARQWLLARDANMLAAAPRPANDLVSLLRVRKRA
jgi:uncharacterized protein (TIGR02246 family)